MELKDSFSKLNLSICFKLTTNGGFQLYKRLKSYTYVLLEIDSNLPQEQQQYITTQYTLSELRLQLGYVDLNQPDIKKEGSKAHPDAEKMAALEKKPNYKRFQDFYNRVLAPEIEEVNRTSDLYIASVEKQCVAYGRVDGVVITIQNNKEYYLKNKNKLQKDQKNTLIAEKPSMSEEQIDDFPDDIRTIIKEPLKNS